MHARSTNTCHLCYYPSNFQFWILSIRQLPCPNPKLMRSSPITSPPRSNLSITEITPRSQNLTTSTLWPLIIGEATTFLRTTSVLNCSMQKLLLIWILKLWRRQFMVWLPSNYLNLYLHDNELVQYKAAIIGTKNTEGTDGNFWSRVLGAVYYDYSL